MGAYGMTPVASTVACGAMGAAWYCACVARGRYRRYALGHHHPTCRTDKRGATTGGHDVPSGTVLGQDGHGVHGRSRGSQVP
jgi:hypothetical protein